MDEYEEFVNKFKPKKTTDDCYTPENIYRAVLRWACDRYGFQEKNVLRPFWPGADYRDSDYPDDCVVVDNPPFSIFSGIVKYYAEHRIRFFLFAPALTALGTVAKIDGTTLLAAGGNIVFENGADVNISFVTNLENSDIVAASVPDLTFSIGKINAENVKRSKKHVRKLAYPSAILTGAAMNYLSLHGVKFSVRRSESRLIRKLDNFSGSIFGGGLLLSKRAAAERAAAERIELSDREMKLQDLLNHFPTGSTIKKTAISDSTTLRR